MDDLNYKMIPQRSQSRCPVFGLKVSPPRHVLCKTVEIVNNSLFLKYSLCGQELALKNSKLFLLAFDVLLTSSSRAKCSRVPTQVAINILEGVLLSVQLATIFTLLTRGDMECVNYERLKLKVAFRGAGSHR